MAVSSKIENVGYNSYIINGYSDTGCTVPVSKTINVIDKPIILKGTDDLTNYITKNLNLYTKDQADYRVVVYIYPFDVVGDDITDYTYFKCDDIMRTDSYYVSFENELLEQIKELGFLPSASVLNPNNVVPVNGLYNIANINYNNNTYYGVIKKVFPGAFRSDINTVYNVGESNYGSGAYCTVNTLFEPYLIVGEYSQSNKISINDKYMGINPSAQTTDSRKYVQGFVILGLEKVEA